MLFIKKTEFILIINNNQFINLLFNQSTNRKKFSIDKKF